RRFFGRKVRVFLSARQTSTRSLRTSTAVFVELLLNDALGTLGQAWRPQCIWIVVLSQLRRKFVLRLLPRLRRFLLGLWFLLRPSPCLLGRIATRRFWLRVGPRSFLQNVIRTDDWRRLLRRWRRRRRLLLLW